MQMCRSIFDKYSYLGMQMSPLSLELPGESSLNFYMMYSHIISAVNAHIWTVILQLVFER